jgi:2-iminobutanoate/2-iminopropanoate deaminase
MTSQLNPSHAGKGHGPRHELKPASLAPDGAAQYAYSYGQRTGNIVWIAGQVPRARDGSMVGIGDAEAQAVQVFENIRAVVEEAGGTLADVVQTTTYITERPARETVGAVRRRYFPGPSYPTATLLIVAGLGLPEYLVEIDAVAVLRD